MQNLFSYPLYIEDIGTGIKTYNLNANPKQLKEIKDILKVDDVLRFESSINVKFNKKSHRIDVNGQIDADVEQTSVISLEKFIKNYKQDFKIFFDTELTYNQLKEMEFDFEDDTPDLLEDGKMDLATIALEQLALILDDFPRKDGEIFSFESEFDEETTKKNNPFAALIKLKK